MVRGNTPTFTFKIKQIPVTSMHDIFISFVQGGKLIFEKTKEDSCVTIDEDENTISVDLTSEETLMFEADDEMMLQLTFLTSEGKVGSTQKYYFDIEASAHFDAR